MIHGRLRELKGLKRSGSASGFFALIACVGVTLEEESPTCLVISSAGVNQIPANFPE